MPTPPLKLFVCTNFKDNYDEPSQAVIVAYSRQNAVLALVADLASKNWITPDWRPRLRELKFDVPGTYIVREIDQAKEMENVRREREARIAAESAEESRRLASRDPETRQPQDVEATKDGGKGGD